MEAVSKSKFQTARALEDVPVTATEKAVRFHTQAFSVGVTRGGNNKTIEEKIIRFRVHGGKFVEIAMTPGLAAVLAAELQNGSKSQDVGSRSQVAGSKALKPGAVPNGRIRWELETMFPSAIVSVLDASYNSPAPESMRMFASELMELLQKFGIKDWDEAFDCEDISWLATALAKIKHWLARRAGMNVTEGVAFGILCYNMGGNSGSGHCICIVRQNHVWKAWEPQVRGFIELSEAERNSAWLCVV